MDTGVYFKLVKRAAKVISGESDRALAARRFVSGILEEYIEDFPRGPVEVFRHPLAAEMALFAKQVSLEEAAYLIGSTYSMLLPDDVRQRNGVFYTPPALANRLLDQVGRCGVDWNRARVLDPACGCGVFLLLAARRILGACSGQPARKRKERILRNLRGMELDGFSAWMCDIFLGVLLQKELGVSGRPEVRIVEVRDSLRIETADLGAFDVVVGNPPYGKVKLDASQRVIWRRGLYGHANLYGLFTDLAVRLASPGGVIAYVTPPSFLGGQYFRSLRALLREEAPPVTFGFVTRREGVFAGVLQETMLSVFKKDGVDRDVSVSYLAVESPNELRVEPNGSYALSGNGDPWIVPRNKTQSSLLKHCGGMRQRLADYGYRVSTGPLVWNRHKDRLSTKRSAGSVPVVWSECVPPGGEGVFRYKVSGRNHVPWYRPKSSMDPNLVHQSCVLVQRTTSLEQKRRLIAAVLPTGFLEESGGCVSVENHLNMIRPLPGRRPLVTPDVLAALLNSRVLDDVFRCINGSTAVSAYELESLPLPEPDSLKRLAKALKTSNTEEIDRLIKEIYTHDDSRAAA